MITMRKKNKTIQNIMGRKRWKKIQKAKIRKSHLILHKTIQKIKRKKREIKLRETIKKIKINKKNSIKRRSKIINKKNN